ncbi:MAG: sigma-70 family RNA polymerase sigma factor [Pyrinomonadaceae bacterium]|nr:sigma-70 family RNA polymerase sigma factor [Sphingobacteriaceae bacterium]
MFKLKDDLTGCLKDRNNHKERIYKRFYGYAMAVIMRYLNDRNDAEELVNDCFIKIFKNISQFNYPTDPAQLDSAFRGWIARISSRTAIDFLRTKKTFLYIEDVGPDNEPYTDINVISRLNAEDILKLLNALPEIHRIIFNMYEIDGFSHDEISETLNIPVSSSRVYLTRAKTKLRSLYAKDINASCAAKRTYEIS